MFKYQENFRSTSNETGFVEEKMYFSVKKLFSEFDCRPNKAVSF